MGDMKSDTSALINPKNTVAGFASGLEIPHVL
jgi:hypothetical protein